MNNTLMISIIALFFFSSEQKKATSQPYTALQRTVLETNQKEHPGKKLIQQLCYSCHSPSASMENRIAPPMAAIKAHYINKQTKKEDFTKSLISYVKKPSADKAKLKGAVRRFGIMPQQVFNEKDLKLIAEYLFDYNIEEPSWFQNHMKANKKN